MSDPTGGWANATAKASEAVSDVTKAAQDFGGVVAGPFKDLIGMLSDKLQVVRAQRQVRLAERLADFLKERGLLNGPTRSIAPNFAVPLIEHATLEEDDELQDVWARMLAVAADAGSEVEMRTAYIRMLADMTAFDVRVLARVARNGRATLALLPDGLLPGDTAEERAWNEQKRSGVRPTRHATHEAIWTAKFRPDVMISIGNLNRLGCLTHNDTNAEITELGRAFVKACTG